VPLPIATTSVCAQPARAKRMGIAASKMFGDFTKDLMQKITAVHVLECFILGVEETLLLIARLNPETCIAG